MWPQLVTIFESPTPHKKSLLKLLFFKCSWEYLILPGAFEDNSLCKIFFLEGRGWGDKQSALWGLKNREWYKTKRFT